jgi:hypothetical protein
MKAGPSKLAVRTNSNKARPNHIVWLVRREGIFPVPDAGATRGTDGFPLAERPVLVPDLDGIGVHDLWKARARAEEIEVEKFEPAEASG